MFSKLVIGFIGGGAIAEALIRGIIKANIVLPDQILVSDVSAQRLDFLAKQFGVLYSTDNKEVAVKSDILFLAVKPQVIESVLDGISGAVRSTSLVISVAAGITIKTLENKLSGIPIIRVMPNTPIAVSCGMSALALGEHASVSHGELALAIFSSVGKAITVKEDMLDAVTGLSGSGPAYTFVLIDALTDAGVRVGLSRQDAIILAAQTLMGAARMVLETGEHPARLRDMVTSPGGTAIAGIHVLEQSGVRAAMIGAVVAATARSREMGLLTK